MLSWNEAEPGGKVSPALESPQIGCEGKDRTGGHRPYARNSAETSHVFIRLRGLAKLQAQFVDLFAEQPDLIQVELADHSNAIRQINSLISQYAWNRTEIGRALGNDYSELCQMAAQGIDELGTMAHKALVSAECYCSRLMLGALDRDVVHVRAQRGLRDRGCIGRVILLAFDERLHIDWRDQPYVVAVTLREPAQKWLVAQASIATMHGDCSLRNCCNRARDSTRLNRTAPPRSVPQTWKLRFARSIARIWTAVICLSFVSATMALSRHHTPMPAGGGIHMG